MYHLVIPHRHFVQTVTALLRQPHMAGLGLAGRNYTRTDMAFLCRDLTLVPGTEPVPALPEDHVRLRLARTAATLHDEGWLGAPPIVQGQPGRAIVHLTLGVEAMRGQWTGTVVETGGRRHPLRTVTLVGPEMATIHPTATGLLPASPTDNGHPDLWSRTIGALGGTAIWQRLTTLRPCIVGVSRTGSLIATSLAQMGVQTLGLIDPDVVEAHQLDAMDGVTPHDLGRPKVAAVAAHLQALCPTLTVTALPHRVTEHPALVKIKEADVLFCCVDNDAARLVTTTLATLYLKPLIDVGTGIFFPPPTTPQSTEVGTIAPPAPRQMGCDVRCVLPGDACLLCAGGLVREAEARRTLATWSPVRPTHLTAPWNQQRAGSLRTLNHLAAHLGVQMWLDLIAGRLDASCWAQVEFDDAGRLRVGYPTLATLEASSRCVLCAKAGLGDAGLGWLAL